MNKHFNKFSAGQRGFTIIELIVVIAIIAVLAAIVLVNVTGYINKGKDAAAEGDLDSLITTGIAWYDSPSGGNGSYMGFIGSGGMLNIAQMIEGMGYHFDIKCNNNGFCNSTDNSSSWCAEIQLKSVTAQTFYCVDSTGAKNAIIADTGFCSSESGSCSQ